MSDLKRITINGVAYDVTPRSHSEDTNNPHGSTADQVGARPNTWMPTAEDVGARPNTWMPTAAEVGARPNTWTPTASEVGAAPAGYGLGTTGQLTNDWNTAVKSGFYYGNTNSPDGGWWAGAVYDNSNNYAFQHLFKSDNPSLQKVRELVNGTWGNWIDCGPSAFAPSGYGLGVASPSWCPNRDCDQAVLSGWYRVSSSNDANNPGQSGVMFVSRYSDACIYQTFYGYSSTAPIKMRSNLGTGFGEWEWVNPPMNLGVEYRTTERHNGKVVYAKAIDFGALPNATEKQVEFCAEGATAVCDLKLHLSDGYLLSSGYGIDRMAQTANGLNLGNTPTKVRVHAEGNYSNLTAYATIKYTKD